MLLDVEQKNNEIILSYYDKEGKVNFKRQPIDQFKNWYVTDEADRFKHESLTNWDGRPIKLGQANGIATLDSSSLLTTSQRPSSTSVLPGSFFSKATAPVRTTGGDGLYKHGSIWFNTSTGRLFVYIPDDRYTGLLDTHNGDIGYWVDVSSPAL